MFTVCTLSESSLSAVKYMNDVDVVPVRIKLRPVSAASSFPENSMRLARLDRSRRLG